MQYLTPRASIGRNVNTLLPFHYRGMGNLAGPITQQQGSLITSGLSIGTGAAVAASFIPASFVPFIGPALAAAGIIIEAIINSGCGQTCIISTEFANKANAALQQNIEGYFAPRMINGKYDPSITLTTESQQAALMAYQQLVNWLIQQCSNPQLGNAGVRCITDRQAGACTWRQPASSVPPWGTPGAGECWNWDNGYRAPIANDRNVAPAAVLQAAAQQQMQQSAPSGTEQQQSTSGSSGAPPSNSNIILFASAAALALAIFSGGNN